MNEYQKIYDAIIEGDEEAALQEAKALLTQAVAPMDIINYGLIAAMDEIGRLYKEEEIFIPEMMMSAQAVTEVINMLKPHMPSGSGSRGSVVIGTVEGDIHDIGKNLVALLLYSNGYAVHDLGNNVAPEDFVAAAGQYDADVVALSALLTTTMENMEHTIEAFSSAGLRDQVKIIIGGAPVTQEYADEIHADGYSENAQEAVELVTALLGEDK